ncbi:unnamed protein product [Clavelina lepadiformis]|uniref:GOLD domain-containing protein n=1 Tax=Clavelina lepadiformis TaxID=159417 RepID=A0ABP0H5I3_CLALP
MFLLFFICILAAKPVVVQLEKSEVSEDYQYQARVTYEFSFVLQPRDRQCFYQPIYSGSKLKFSYKVLTASTAMSSNAIIAEVRRPNGESLYRVHLNSEAESPMWDITSKGDYEFCFNNFMAKFLEKKIEVFIGIIHPHVFDEVKQLGNDTVEMYHNMTEQVWNILGTLFHVVHSMHFMRNFANVDMTNALANLAFVNRCSIVLILLIVTIAWLQTYSLKRLFHSRIHRSYEKPRA